MKAFLESLGGLLALGLVTACGLGIGAALYDPPNNPCTPTQVIETAT
jgi:hypothetical protein